MGRQMTRLCIAIGALAIMMAAMSTGRASADVGLEGAEPFGFFAWFASPVKFGEVAQLRISMRGEYADSITALAHIDLPGKVALVGGDTLHSGHPARADAEWTIDVRPIQHGACVIRGSVRIRERAGVADEGEFVLALEIGADTVRVGTSRLVRAEHVEGARRFRYAGEYLVPIDQPEYVMQRDINMQVGKPRILERTAAVDTLHRVAARVRSIPFVVFVGADGGMRDARPRGGMARDAYLVSIGRVALGQWRFAPATAAGRAVADWLEVRVEVAR